MEDEGRIVPITSKLIKSPKDLEVFKKAYTISLAIHKVSLTFPKIEQYALVDQLRRSSKFICANITEGFAKQNYSAGEFARFLAMAEGSVVEVQVRLQYANDLGYISKEQFYEWDDNYLTVKAMLHNLRKRL